jgi:hypothetical protein
MPSNFSEFQESKKKEMDVYLRSRIVRLAEWRIKIVNVSETGWYAPVIEAVSYKIEKGNEKQKENFKDVCMVLYEGEIKEAMEMMRLGDIRELNRVDPSERLVSMAYHMKKHQEGYNAPAANLYRVELGKEKKLDYND